MKGLTFHLSRLRGLLFVREVEAALRKPLQSGLGLVGAFAFSFGIWWSCSWLIQLVHQVPGLGQMVLDRFLYLAFLSLFVGLCLSSSTVAYFHLYRAREVRQWIHWPLPASQIIFWKGVETWILSSWAFLLVGLIAMLAYAQQEGLPWGFLLRCLVYFLPFSLLAAAIGIWVALLWAQWVTNRRRLLVGLGLILAGLAWVLRNQSSGWGSQTASPFLPQLPYFWLYSSPWLPSSWLTQGLLSFKIPGERGALLALALLTSHALLAWNLLGWGARRWYLDSWDRQASFTTQTAYLLGRTFWDRVGGWFRWWPDWVRVIALRDLKRFWRDPVQWPQAVITFGILGIYFANLRTLAYDVGSEEWKTLIAYLNFVGLSFSLVSLNIRFLLPEMSLELRQLWVVGLTPIALPRIFRVKCLIHMTNSYIVVCSLLALSNATLRLDRQMAGFLMGLMMFLVFPMVAIPLSLGARFPQVKEDNPLKMISGLGGTLAFVVCLCDVLFILGGMAFPFVQAATGRIPLEDLWPMVWKVGVGAAALCLLTGGIALRMGMSALRRVEPLLEA